MQFNISFNFEFETGNNDQIKRQNITKVALNLNICSKPTCSYWQMHWLLMKSKYHVKYNLRPSCLHSWLPEVIKKYVFMQHYASTEIFINMGCWTLLLDPGVQGEQLTSQLSWAATWLLVTYVCPVY